MKCLTFLISILIFISCTDTSMQQELADTKTALQAAQANIADLEARIEPEGDLVHLVFFRMKADADLDAFVTEVKRLGSIEGVMDFEIGPFENLGDGRALSDYAMMMQMSFADTTTYRTYQQNPVHLEVRKNTKSAFSGPPATYDFVKQ